MRRLLISLISLLFIGHAMAVVEPCEGIEQHTTDMLTTKWRAIVDRHTEQIRLIYSPLFNTRVTARLYKLWQSPKTSNTYQMLEELFKVREDIANEWGLSKLYTKEDLDALRDRAMLKVSTIKTDPGFSEFLGLQRRSISSWKSGSKGGIGIRGQISLNFVAQHLDDLERPASDLLRFSGTRNEDLPPPPKKPRRFDEEGGGAGYNP